MMGRDLLSIAELEKRIDYVFKNKKLLERAVTHRSFSAEHNERLEFLGDSVLGYKSHMGAGSITSNVKSDKSLVVVKGPEGILETGRKKFGAVLGDNVEVGCNSVLNPGTVVGRNSNIYPTSCVRGVIPADSIYKDKDNIIHKR